MQSRASSSPLAVSVKPVSHTQISHQWSIIFAGRIYVWKSAGADFLGNLYRQFHTSKPCNFTGDFLLCMKEELVFISLQQCSGHRLWVWFPLKLERGLISFLSFLFDIKFSSATYYCPLQDMPHGHGHIVWEQVQDGNVPEWACVCVCVCVDSHDLSWDLIGNYPWQRFRSLICSRCENINSAFLKVNLSGGVCLCRASVYICVPVFQVTEAASSREV